MSTKPRTKSRSRKPSKENSPELMFVITIQIHVTHRPQWELLLT